MPHHIKDKETRRAILNRLLEHMAKHGLSKAELARQMNVTPECAYFWLKRRYLPSPETVAKIGYLLERQAEIEDAT